MESATQDIISIMQSFSEQMDRQFLIVNQQFAKMEQQFVVIHQQFEKIDQQFVRVNERLDRIEVRLDRVEARLDQVEARLDRIDVRLDSIERRVEKIEVTVVTRDYLDLRLVDQRRDMIELTRKEDKKVGALIRALNEEQSISQTSAKEILSMEPFPS